MRSVDATLQQNTSLTITDDVSSDPKRLKCHSIVENVEGNRAKVIAQVNFEWWVGMER